MRASVALLAVVATGCFAKPGFGGAADDASADDGHAPKLRLINTAYAASYDVQPAIRSSPGMSGTTWEISTSGIRDGDLVLFIANVDNGSNRVREGPTGPIQGELTGTVRGTPWNIILAIAPPPL
ncbi:hypothetical protein BH11MYX3_BH11MYX3_45130 [soil metagenome]